MITFASVFVFTSFLNNIPCIVASGITFGFKTPTLDDGAHGTSQSDITMTLYWSTTLLQCIVTPGQLDTYYHCDSTTSTLDCDTSSTTYEGLYAFQIDNSGHDAVEIEQIKIITEGNIFIYDNFCYNVPPKIHSSQNINIINKTTTNHCMDALYDGYARVGIDTDQSHPYVLFEFNQTVILDLSSPTNLSQDAYINTIVTSGANSICPPILTPSPTTIHPTPDPSTMPSMDTTKEPTRMPTESPLFTVTTTVLSDDSELVLDPLQNKSISKREKSQSDSENVLLISMDSVFWAILTAIIIFCLFIVCCATCCICYICKRRQNVSDSRSNFNPSLNRKPAISITSIPGKPKNGLMTPLMKGYTSLEDNEMDIEKGSMHSIVISTDDHIEGMDHIGDGHNEDLLNETLRKVLKVPSIPIVNGKEKENMIDGDGSEDSDEIYDNIIDLKIEPIVCPIMTSNDSEALYDEDRIIKEPETECTALDENTCS